MKYVAILIAGTAAAMAALTWDTPTAMAWIVAFCGWVQLCFSDDKVKNGNS